MKVAAGAVEVTQDLLIFGANGGRGMAVARELSEPLKPADDCFIVMRFRVGDAVPVVTMRQMIARPAGTESELHHAHAGETKAVAQRRRLRGELAKVLGNDRRQVAHRAAKRREDLRARRGRPLSPAGGGGVAGDVPGVMKAQEMIDPRRVEPAVHRFESIDPPRKSTLLVHRPVVLRMPPGLSVGAETVRRI